MTGRMTLTLPKSATVNGDLSLADARLHYSECGAAHPRFLPYVRKPEVSEQ
jgi:hypothetical protein